MDLSAKIRGFIERTERPVHWWASAFAIVGGLLTTGGIIGAIVRPYLTPARFEAEPVTQRANGEDDHEQRNEVPADPEERELVGGSVYNRLHMLPLALAAADEGSVPARSEDGELLIETATACLKKLSARSIEISFGGTMQDEETGAVTADSMIYTVRGPYGEALASGIELAPESSEYGPR